MAGLPTAESLAGKHVHIGGLKIFRKCCPHLRVVGET